MFSLGTLVPSRVQKHVLVNQETGNCPWVCPVMDRSAAFALCELGWMDGCTTGITKLFGTESY